MIDFFLSRLSVIQVFLYPAGNSQSTFVAPNSHVTNATPATKGGTISAVSVIPARGRQYTLSHAILRALTFDPKMSAVPCQVRPLSER